MLGCHASVAGMATTALSGAHPVTDPERVQRDVDTPDTAVLLRLATRRHGRVNRDGHVSPTQRRP
jgi:hypothetical protein